MREIRAAICDDEAMQLEMISSALVTCFQKFDVTLNLDRFLSSSRFAKQADKENYQLVFLDIDMPEIDGISLGVKLKKLQEKTVIIFISNCEDRVFDAFSAKPFGFVRKSSFLHDVQSVVKLYIETYVNVPERFGNETLEVKTHASLVRLSLSEIMYIEGARETQKIHLSGGKEPLEVRDRLKNFEEQLSEKGFIRVHIGFIVNYHYIKRISKTAIELTNGEHIPVSRKNNDEILKTYMRLCRIK